MSMTTSNNYYDPNTNIYFNRTVTTDRYTGQTVTVDTPLDPIQLPRGVPARQGFYTGPSVAGTAARTNTQMSAILVPERQPAGYREQVGSGAYDSTRRYAAGLSTVGVSLVNQPVVRPDPQPIQHVSVAAGRARQISTQPNVARQPAGGPAWQGARWS